MRLMPQRRWKKRACEQASHLCRRHGLYFMRADRWTGAEMVIAALKDQGVEHIFGYPGGAVLPIYDALFQQNKVRHILVRHEQGAVHAAEGYARSTGKVGVVLVTSGPAPPTRSPA
jgi:glyoxylate carboligase